MRVALVVARIVDGRRIQPPFGVMAAFGCSINTLTMFAMVPAIGLLVDDAIVVIEKVRFDGPIRPRAPNLSPR
jgi:Cu/Ag efflux pump CusA